MIGSRAADGARTLRLLIWAALILGWLAMLVFLWSAFATLPSPERLQETRMARIPTLGTVAWTAGRSALELTALLILLLPRARLYTLRLGSAVIALPVWFIVTAPLTLTAVEWTHRRWLAGMELGLLLALLVYLVVRRGRPGRTRPDAV